MAYGQDIEDSMAANFARAGIGTPREVTGTLYSLANVEKAKVDAGAVQDVAALKAAAQTEAAKTTALAHTTAAGTTSLRDLAGRKYVADQGLKAAETQKDYTKTKEGVQYLTEGTPQAQALGRQQVEKHLGNVLLQEHGINDPTDKTGQTKVLPGYARDTLLKALPKIKGMQDVPGVLEQIRPELEMGKQVDPFNNTATRDASREAILTNYRQQAQAAGRTVDPNTENYIKTAPVTKDNLFWFKQFQPAQTAAPSAASQPPSLKAAATAKPAASESWTPNKPNPWPGLLKKAASYGQKDWESMPLPFRASGGPVEEDKPYIVGEKGPEVFVPEKKGTILPDLSALAPVRQSKFDEVALGGKG